MAHDERKTQLQIQIKEQEVLKSEMSSLKRGAKVYKQQQNSNVFFLADRENVFSECKRTLDNLIQEYKEAETAKPSEEIGEYEET